MATVVPDMQETTGASVADPGGRGGQLRLVVAGSVDDGKSTLVGRLLHDTKSILADQYDAIEAVSRRRGADAVDLALLTDGLRAEREQGITIDVAYRYFATPRRSFILADTPGHTQYTRNTVTGASTADAALVLVDVRNGITVQTRRHLAVMALLRVPHVVVVVNKMDAVNWSRTRFEDIAEQARAIAARLGMSEVQAVPVSALTGRNVVSRQSGGSADPACGWDTGPSLLEVVESLDDHEVAAALPLRLPVQLVIRPRSDDHPDYRGLAGRVASGSLRVGDDLVAQPSGVRARVVGLDTPTGPAQVATAGDSVTVRLAPEVDIGRGQVLAHPGEGPIVRDQLTGVVCWLDERPGAPGQRVLVKAGTSVVRAVIDAVEDHWQVEDQRWSGAGSRLELNDIARVRVLLSEPVAVDAYATDRSTGAFLVIDPAGGATLAAGMVGDPLGHPPGVGPAGPGSRQRAGHRNH